MRIRNHRWYLITEQTCRSGQPGPWSPSTDFGLQQRRDERGDVLLQTSPVSQLHLGDERLARHFDGEYGEPVTVACHPGTRRALRTSAQDSQRFVSLCPLFFQQASTERHIALCLSLSLFGNERHSLRQVGVGQAVSQR